MSHDVHSLITAGANGIEPALPLYLIKKHFDTANKNRSAFELETMYLMLRAYISYRLSSEKQKAPGYRDKVSLEVDYMKQADKLFGI